ncbi:MAG: M2 family metallopeptidase [Candidatus Omnitrophota bacterium]
MNKMLLAGWLVVLLLSSVYGKEEEVESQLRQFIADRVKQLEPMALASALAQWKASTTGREEDYEQFNQWQLKIKELYSDRNAFAQVKKWKESQLVKDELLRRQLDLLYWAHLRNQIEPELLKQIVALDTKIQKTYNTFRGEMDGKKVTNSDIYKIMTAEKDSRIRELAWRASKQVGDVIAKDLIQLVKLRNQAARPLGFDNYHTLSITAGEQDVKELDRIFQTLDDLTRRPFAEMKAELDQILAKDYGVEASALMPWHYHDPFFQRTPLVYEFNLDRIYEKFDVKQLAEKFYAGIGLPVDDILARSDLYDREGKDPNAFSTDIDRKGDVRILCNLNNDERWMETILHELGHAVYDKYHDMDLPYLLREPAHSFATEGVAMFFGRLSRNADWMKAMLDLPNDDYAAAVKVGGKYLRFQQILFARWALVMYHFEKQLYADPDGDLNNLWWDMVKKYQLVNPPAEAHGANWAAKFHFTIAPCYYHNYMLGELFASQLSAAIVRNAPRLSDGGNVRYVGDKAVGDFLREKVFAPGSRYSWNEMIERATGEKLNPKYFVEQFLQ